ncbi:MAG: hypothetical protein J7L53_03910, partial [Deltaproteobacteria bacterium]|nr:hypothetical protein [Deltaproteobacteria bacterium]
MCLWVDAWSPSDFNWHGANLQLARQGGIIVVNGDTQISLTNGYFDIPFTITGLETATSYELHMWVSGYEFTVEEDKPWEHKITAQATGVSLELIPYSGSITGRITRPDGVLNKNVVVTVKSMWGCGEGGEIDPVNPGDDGSYSVTGLGTGDYLVIVNEVTGDPPMPTGNVAMESEMVFVANGDTTTLNIDLSAPLTVTGTITDNEGILAGHNVVAVAVPIQFAMGDDIEAGMIMAPVDTDNNTFELKVAPGTYIITLESEDVDFACDQLFKVVSEDTDVALTVEEGNTATVTVNFSEPVTKPDGEPCAWLGGIQLFKGEQPVGEWTGVVVGTSDWDDEDIELENGATSAAIPFENLLDGEYTVRFFSEEFIMGSVNLTVAGTDVNATMTLKKGATIQGKVVDADTGTKITDAIVQCEAIPHKEGSFKSTEWAGPEGAFDENGVFHLRNLPEGTYLLKVTYEGSDSSTLNYAATSMYGITLTGTGTTDVGTIKLKKGSIISGRVTNSSGEGLPNIPVEAEYMDSKYGSILLEAKTDPEGYYTIKGVDPDVAYYEVDAGTRPDPWEMMMQPCGYGEEMKLNITPGSENVDFVLYETTASLEGTITKPAGSSTAFAPPFNDEGMDLPVAFIVMQKKGVPASDPMDGIEAMSNPSEGDSTTYLVDNLVPGTYKVSVYSNGLCTYVKNNLEIQAGSNTLDITLTEGATVSGTVTKPDGTHPTTTDIEEVVAMNADQELVFGTFTKDPATGEILSYEIKGLEVGATYHVALCSPGEEGPGDIYVQADTVTPNAATDSFTLNAVMAETAPTFMMTATKDGSEVNVSIFSTAHLMDATADDMIDITTGYGTVSDKLLSPDKMMTSFTYTPVQGESSFGFTITAHYGADYTQAQESYIIDLTVDGANQGLVNTFMGGKVNMGGGDASGVCFEPGDIEDNGDGKTVVDVTKAEVGAGSESAAESIFAAGVIIAPEATDALPSWATAVSRQYDFSIGADAIADGQSVTVTLQYTDGADTDNLHVLHYTSGAWQVEATSKSIDTENKTITVDVTSLSPFVAVEGTVPDDDDSGSTPLYSGGSSGGGCFVETACSTGGIAGMLLPLLFMIPLVKTRRRK